MNIFMNHGGNLLVLVGIAVVGCGDVPSHEQQEEASAEYDRLSAISTAYNDYTAKNNKPPTGPDELKPFFPESVDSATVFTSARDGQPYVIIWGTDSRKQSGNRPLVFGYEQTGKDGSRMVLTGFGVMEMTDTQFKYAVFPPGEKTKL